MHDNKPVRSAAASRKTAERLLQVTIQRLLALRP